ncbi:metallophosphoesterase [Thermococcus sp. SY098]|uniref:metallophosphoesterase n=1 Tax=Thermococcus sp. SY098 TaxID=3111325 RepID=UPI002D76FF97|nr:metallophosphoesterase [Thermococcus sp. SY098]WRS52997.1 metallophosphoesterase [Thermococcus sp. SY098]
MVRIGILSDTHYPDKTSYLPNLIFEKFQEDNVELIIHAGDLTSPSVKEVLENVAPVVAVRGNLDELIFPEERILEVEELKIGIIHGHQFLSLDTQTLKYKALDMEVDILIFGHTHRFFYEVYEFMGKKIALLNPGSPTVPRRSDPTFVIAEIKDRNLHFNIFKPWKTQWQYP